MNPNDLKIQLNSTRSHYAVDHFQMVLCRIALREQIFNGSS